MAKSATRVIKNNDDLSIATIRSFCIDAINKSKSGHPGMAISAAPIMYSLYKDFLMVNPKDPNWINRDRFVLSAGHGSILLYTILHIAGYKISLDDLKNFRQLGSITPGHPEVGVTEGVDASSGPLGQGIAQAVGMAMAETKLQSLYGKEIYNHYTYCLCGDGCLEEGISQEAISFAGLNKLNKLILLYDRNNVTLDGPLSQSSDEDVINRFISCGWNVIVCYDGNNYKKIRRAIKNAKKSKKAPTIVIFKTTIGLGSKNEGTCKVHGSPLGAEDGKKAKLSYGFDFTDFTIAPEVYETMRSAISNRVSKYYDEYDANLESNPNYAKALELSTNNVTSLLADDQLSDDLFKTDATRNSSGVILNHYHELLPTFVGGSADVAASVKTALKNGTNWTFLDRSGTNIHWGIREFFMSSAANGILLHGGLRTYVGTFLVFSDYCKAAIRMSALQKLPQIYLFSHDSLAVGEDGPTHQPIEQIAALRAIPNLNVFRPCDGREVAASYKLALESTETPSALILSRQNLTLFNKSDAYDLVKRGAYIIAKERNPLSFTLIASGSEVEACIKVKANLEAQGFGIRVVSMPCTRLFDLQNGNYQARVLGPSYDKRAVVEMGSSYGLHKYAKFVVGVNTFGASGKAEDVINAYGFSERALTLAILDKIR